MAALADTGKTIRVASPEDLPAAARAFLTFLVKNPTVSTVIFEGEMGAGKTTFIKALCRELGVADAVSSPTFSLVNEYRTEAGKTLYHFDFYRINHENEALDLGFYDYLDSGNLCLIEWPSKIPSLLPEDLIEVEISASPDGMRTLTLKRT